MDRKEEATKKILEAVGITEPQIDLVSRILALQEDERVDKIALGAGTVGYQGISATVEIRKSFNGEEDFRNYLQKHNLPTDKIWTESENTQYLTQSEGVRANFNIPYRIRKGEDRHLLLD